MAYNPKDVGQDLIPATEEKPDFSTEELGFLVLRVLKYCVQ